MRFAILLVAITFISLATITADSQAGYSRGTLIERQIDALEQQISHYQTLAMRGGWPSFPAGRPIEPNAQDTRIPILRAILSATGDFDGNLRSDSYDEPLIAAVMRFQQRHGLESDGIVGVSTTRALNVPARERLAQLQVNLDRLRDYQQQAGANARAIIVNIPAYELYALNGGEIDRQMRVIVGSARNRTPLMENHITSLHFNPVWNVPSRIAMNEMLPKIKNDPNYLARRGYSLIANGASVDPSSVDWESVDRSNFNYRIRQRSGSSNALGKVKFFLPDSNAIYLHDTSQPKLFAKAERAMSHGCIRLENPVELAKFVTQSEAEYSPEQIESMYTKSSQRSISLNQPVPVSVVYWTAWINNAGQPVFYDDVYRKDSPLIAEKLKELDTMQLAANE